MPIVHKQEDCETLNTITLKRCKTWPARSTAESQCTHSANLLDSHRLGKVAGEVHVETFTHGKPVSDQLQGNDVEQTLEAVDSLGHFDLFRLRGGEFGVIVVADDNRTAATSNNCRRISLPLPVT